MKIRQETEVVNRFTKFLTSLDITLVLVEFVYPGGARYWDCSLEFHGEPLQVIYPGKEDLCSIMVRSCSEGVGLAKLDYTLTGATLINDWGKFKVKYED